MEESTRRARALRKQMTEAEARLWTHLRRRQMRCRYRRQHPIDRFIVDFVCLEHRVVVECDGSQHALSAYDRWRDLVIERHGFVVMRFWNEEILGDLDMVLSTIERHLEPDFDHSTWLVRRRPGGAAAEPWGGG